MAPKAKADPRAKSAPARHVRAKAKAQRRCADVLLHETAVSWMRKKLTATTPRRPWLESRDQYAARLRRVVADINRSYAVGALCQRFPDRLDELVRRQGDRLRS